ncbi:MAG: arylesterase [Betaproteobacteria bacterium HGW-Betaproteobacteria-22]|nr:MAG: arylesterase [Betaproteobacteria bacterium HGW-Betaproteobacteria-22]
MIIKRLIHLGLVCVTGLLLACNAKPEFAALPKGANVLVLGDSLSYGTGAAKGEDYVSLLAVNTQWQLINAGVPGNTSADGLQRLPSLLEAYHADESKVDLLIVELGGNDFLRQMPEAETRNNLKAILQQAKANQIQAVLLAIPEFSPIGAAFGSLSDHELYAALAKETGTPLIEDIFSEVLAKNALKSDAIHPNAQGYKKVEESLRKALEKLGFLKKQ